LATCLFIKKKFAKKKKGSVFPFSPKKKKEKKKKKKKKGNKMWLLLYNPLLNTL
jgi:hypothetical protein